MLRLISWALLLATMNAWASPPTPDSDSNCGGNCQAICINGCDQNAVTYPGATSGPYYSRYSWQQARCAVSREVAGAWADPTVTVHYQAWDPKKGSEFCLDGYTCDSGPCGREGERSCNPFGTGCQTCVGDLRPWAGKCTVM